MQKEANEADFLSISMKLRTQDKVCSRKNGKLPFINAAGPHYYLTINLLWPSGTLEITRYFSKVILWSQALSQNNGLGRAPPSPEDVYIRPEGPERAQGH